MPDRPSRPRAPAAPRSRRGGPDFLTKGLARAAVTSRTGPFTCGLSTGAFELCADAGLRRVAQVMGSCVYSLGVSGAPVLGDPGYREYFGRAPNTVAVMFEMRRLSDAYDRARETALSRLRDEAAQCGAHAVVELELTRSEEDSPELRTVEYVVIGTAVRLDVKPSAQAPLLSGLSAADYWSLWTSGFQAVGIASASSIYYVRPSLATAQAQAQRWSAGRVNQEFPEFSTAVSRARQVRSTRMRGQAERLNGAGIVAVCLEMSHRRGEEHSPSRNQGRTRYADLHVTVHAMGTVVRPRRGNRTQSVTAPMPVVNLGSKRVR